MEPTPPGRLPANIILIGYRGTGKTTVARLLAEKLGWCWRDADEVLEQRFGCNIKSIFIEEGEAGFRLKETAVLTDLCQLSGHVIACGGGAVLRSENRARIKAAGWVVWLTADAQTLWNRVQGDASSAERRPALTSGGLDEIVQLLNVREAYYADCANTIIDTAGRAPDEVVSAILERLSEQAPRDG